MPGGEDQQSGYGRDANLVGLLSLQLLLLAFFILLVSMSTFDVDRVRSVLGSVQAAFSEASSVPEAEDERQRADAVVLDEITEEIEGVLTSAIQLDRVERTGPGAISFELSADDLFAPDSARLLPGRDLILDRVIDALDRRPSGYRYDIDLLVGRVAAEAADLDAESGLAVDRAGLLARTMREGGALESGLAAGLLPAAAGRVRVVIALTDAPRRQDLFAAGRPVADGAAPPETAR